MTETLSIPIDSETKKRLEVLAEKYRRSTTDLAEEAISRYLEIEAWQMAEIERGIADVDEGRTIDHEDVVAWLRTWGTRSEGKAP